jgi:acyl dehydratase
VAAGRGVISDAELDALRALEGSRLAVPARPHVEFATVDTIRNFARSTGDDNPLYCDPAVAERSVHGGLIAPQLFPLASGTDAPGAPTSEPEAMRALRGGHVEVLLDTWHFHAPVRPGVRLTRTDTLTEVSRSEGRTPSIVMTVESRYTNGSTLHATHERKRRHVLDHRAIHAPREKARYTDAEIDAIERAIAAWSRRGATPRLCTSVAETEHIGPLVKGPLTVTDLVAYRGGVGAGPFDVEPLELAIQNRAKRPGFYDRTDTNAWDARERLHWDEAYAQQQGHISAYDYSHTRLVWAAQLLTDWMGDSGRLEWISFRQLENNYVGDTQWLRAVITRVARRENDGTVEISFDAHNQLGGAPTASGAASVVLPMR